MQNISISVTFQQITYANTFLSTKPVVSFSTHIPYDSPVFSAIEDGDLDGLIKLLSEGQASLNDRDVEGRCLLHVSAIGFLVGIY